MCIYTTEQNNKTIFICSNNSKTKESWSMKLSWYLQMCVLRIVSKLMRNRLMPYKLYFIRNIRRFGRNNPWSTWNEVLHPLFSITLAQRRPQTGPY